MCGVQRVPPLIFLNNGKYNAGLLKELIPHTHTSYLSAEGHCVWEVYLCWTKIVAILLQNVHPWRKCH